MTQARYSPFLSELPICGLIKAANLVLSVVEIDLVGISVCQQEHYKRPTFELHSLARMPGMLEESCAQSKGKVLVMTENTTATFISSTVICVRDQAKQSINACFWHHWDLFSANMARIMVCLTLGLSAYQSIE